MKARTVASKKDIERVNEAVWKLTLESIIDGNAVMLIAAKHFFGLGPKRMKANMRVMCSVCGKTFLPGNTKGLPNGIGYMLQDGTLFNMCAQCIIDFGRMTDAEKDKFFKDHGIRK